MTNAISYQDVVAFVSLLGVIIGIWAHLENKSKSSKNEMTERIDDLSNKCDNLLEKHNSFKLHVAENYVGNTKMEKLEKSIMDELKFIRDKLDSVTFQRPQSKRNTNA